MTAGAAAASQPPAAAAPAMAEWSAPADWQRIDLMSDVHLHPGMPRTFECWRDHLLNTPADAVLILGDLFEVWVGDDCRHQGFEVACVQVLQRASRRCQLAFLPGNRDFLVGEALLTDTGMRRLADPTVLQAFGRRWLLSHGDALCTDDHDYMRFRAQVRSAAWQQRFLALPLAERQQQARAMRDASQQHQARLGPQQWSDANADTVRQWLALADAPVLVHGHTHRPDVHDLGAGRVRHVLGDWDLDGSAPRAVMAMLTPDGLQAMDLVGGRHARPG